MHEQAVIGCPVAQTAEGLCRLVQGPGAAEDVDRVERACPDALRDAEQLLLTEAEDAFLVELGRNADVGRAGEPPPAGIELRHRHAVIGEEQADVPIAESLVARPLVVAPPQRHTGEAAGVGGRKPLAERGAGPDGARAQDGIARAEGHRSAGTGRNGLAGVGHCGRRVLVTIVPFVPEHGTGTHETAAVRV